MTEIARGDVRYLLPHARPTSGTSRSLGIVLLRENRGGAIRCSACRDAIAVGDLHGASGETSVRYCLREIGSRVEPERWPRWIRSVKGLGD